MSPDLVRSVRALSAQTPDMSVRSAPLRGRTADTDTDKSKSQRAAEALRAAALPDALQALGTAPELQPLKRDDAEAVAFLEQPAGTR